MWKVPVEFFDDDTPICKNVRVRHPDDAVTVLGDVHFDDMDEKIEQAVKAWKPSVQ